MDVSNNNSLSYNKKTTDKKLSNKVDKLEQRIEEIEQGNINVDLEEYAKKEDLPSKTSELENDSNFADEKYVDDAIDFLEKIQWSDTPPTDAGVTVWVNTSEDMPITSIPRINDNVVSSTTIWTSERTDKQIVNRIAQAKLEEEEIDLSGYATKDELHEHENKTLLDEITEEMVSNWNNKSEFDGDYDSLTNKPDIPSIEGLASEDYVNNYVENAIKDIPKEEVDLSGYALKEELHEHNNKTVLDTITEQMVSDWNNKSEFSGSYNDLTNKPNIPSIEGLATEEYVSNKIAETTDSLEVITSSDVTPTDENVAIWINTSEDTASNPLARVSDDIVSNGHTWSSEKINNLFNSLKLVKEGNTVKLMLGNIELSNISI